MFTDSNQNRGAVHKGLLKAVCNPLLKLWVGDRMAPRLTKLKQMPVNPQDWSFISHIRKSDTSTKRPCGKSE